jgi:hypothetical protein
MKLLHHALKLFVNVQFIDNLARVGEIGGTTRALVTGGGTSNPQDLLNFILFLQFQFGIL